MPKHRVHYKFPKIRRIGDISRAMRATGKDSLAYYGTVKMHGTNAAVVVTMEGDVYAQSRNRVLPLGCEDPTTKHFGFRQFVDDNKEEFTETAILTHASLAAAPGGECLAIVYYGEWIGPGVQKKVAVSQLKDKHFAIFAAVAILQDDKEEWLESYSVPTVCASALSFGVYYEDVPVIGSVEKERTKEHIQALTLQVEASCPVAKALEGIEGIGEGIVWRCLDFPSNTALWFKSKGDKHQAGAKQRNKQGGNRADKLEALELFATAFLTEARLEQGVEYLAEMGLPRERRSIPDFIKYVVTDLLDEVPWTSTHRTGQWLQADAPPYTENQLKKHVASAAAQWFRELVG